MDCSYCHSFPGTIYEEFTRSDGVLPIVTSGRATGGGQIVDGRSQEHVSFAFAVNAVPEARDREQGRCVVVDQATGTQVKCLDVTSYQQIGNTATWQGPALVNGVAQTYTITVQDNGEPNAGADTFAIATPTYRAAGAVARGNVQLHAG